MATQNAITLSGAFGLTVTVEDGQGIVSYAQMRADQLDALTAILATSELDSYHESVQRDVLWLISTLATEVKELMPIVYERGQQRGLNSQQEATRKIKPAPGAASY